MSYDVRKTELSDLNYLPPVERSAGIVYTLLPDLAWIADGSVMSVDEHKRVLAKGFSWVALDTLSQTISGFIIAEIIEGEFYVGEVSVSATNQQKGIGSKLFETALTEARSLGLPAATLTTFIDVPWNAPYYERLGFVIITSELLPLYLQRILQDEKSAGLPLERRCAMRKIL
ncbi:MAG: GNAT family N-acetyltransferase [Robiginitomaculum sp.]|nr:GNAT family N-acetyltransferase [Robiginitomaculum sp.]